MSAQTTSHDYIIRLPEVRRRVGVSGTTLWRWYTAGKFPTPRKLGPGSVGWLNSEVEAWIGSRQATVTKVAGA